MSRREEDLQEAFGKKIDKEADRYIGPVHKSGELTTEDADYILRKIEKRVRSSANDQMPLEEQSLTTRVLLALLSVAADMGALC